MDRIPAPPTQPRVKGHLCPDCKGTGSDAAQTRALCKRPGDGHIRCWTCNGNGLDPAAYFRSAKSHFIKGQS